MAEYETYARLDGETDIDIDMKQFTYKEVLVLIKKILFGQTVTFEDVYVELEGDVTVEVEPSDYN